MTVLGLIGDIINPLIGNPSFRRGLPDATRLLSAIIRAITLAAGIWVLINFVLAGFGYITSAGNPEQIKNSWARIYRSIIGLSIIVLSFAFAAILGMVLYDDPTAIISPVLTGPAGP